MSRASLAAPFARPVGHAVPVVVARLVALVAALAVAATLAAAPVADARGPSTAKPWLLRAAPSGATRLGPVSLRSASAPVLARRVGGRAKLRRRGGRCVARFPRVGLRATLVAPRGAGNPCGRAGRVAEVVLAGRAARGRYRTDRGVAVGASARVLARRHRSAVRRSSRLWWLRSADDSLAGRRFGVVAARLGGGRLRALVGVTGVTAPAVGRAEGGVWTGTVEGDVTAGYGLTMALRAGPAKPGDRVGSTDYSRLDCGGTLTLVGRTRTELRLAETIIYGADRCVDRGVIRFAVRPDGASRWSFRGTSPDATSRRPTATPTRRDVAVDVSDRIDADEAGAWRGAVEGDSSAYDVALELTAGPRDPGAATGTVAYPQLGCSGPLTYVGRTFATVVLRERVAGGSCAPEGVETFRLDGVQARWAYEDRLAATLVRP